MDQQRAIAVVGVGPRGLSVVERLLIRLRRFPAPVVVWAVDAVQHGSGRIWRTSQPDWFAMNATGGEVTAWSPDSPVPPEDFVDWAARQHIPVGPVDYPSRRVYGRYLNEVFNRLRECAPPHVSVRPVRGEATALRRRAGRMVLTVGGEDLVVDKVVLATGHNRVELSREQVRLQEHGRYLAPDIAPDMPLAEIEPGSTVAVRGLGLSCYDVVRSLTTGRDGTFHRDSAGRLRYRPSGAEPRIVAGSRSGLPFLARARFDVAPDASPKPTVLTTERIGELRARAVAERGTPQLDFAREVEPLIRDEAQTAARQRGGDGSLRLDALARPFDKREFTTPQSFRDCLVRTLRSDVAEARRGHHVSPVKAALEMLRAIRPVLPSVVDFGGLLPGSHKDFLTRFAPWSFILSAGPPDGHVEELVALIEAGVADVVGPAARFGTHERPGKFTVESTNVAGSARLADAMIDARVPATDIRRSTSPLTRQLLADGMISEFVNVDPVNGDSFATGGLAITRTPCRVLDASGRADPDIYAIGVATEHARWFTQVGTGRPGQDSPFCREADAIAADIAGGLR